MMPPNFGLNNLSAMRDMQPTFGANPPQRLPIGGGMPPMQPYPFQPGLRGPMPPTPQPPIQGYPLPPGLQQPQPIQGQPGGWGGQPPMGNPGFPSGGQPPNMPWGGQPPMFQNLMAMRNMGGY